MTIRSGWRAVFFIALLSVCSARVASAQLTVTQFPGGTFSIGQVASPLVVTGGTGGPYTWSLLSGTLPPGLSLRTDFGGVLLIGIATTPGTYNFTLHATDGTLGVDQACTVKISPVTVKDLFNQPDGFVGVPYSYQLTALGATGSLTWTPGSGLAGSGLSLSPSGLLSGTPTSPGTYNFGFSLSDSGTGDTVGKGYQVKVNLVGISNDGVLPNATQGSVYSTVNLAPTPGGTAPYNFTITGGSLPPGLGMNGAGAISGTISTSAAVNVYAFSVKVQDSSSNAYTKNMSIALVGVPPKLPSVTVSGNFEDCTLGVPCSRSFAVSNGNGGKAPFVWSATGLPDGITIRSALPTTNSNIQAGDAELWGTPTQLGNFNVVVTVTDADLKTVTNTYPMHVSSLYQLGSLQSGTLNSAYTGPIAVIGGTLPYSITDLGSHIPQGLTLSTGPSGGALSGTPLESGKNFAFNAYYKFTDASVSPDTLRNSNYFSINGASAVDITSFFSLSSTSGSFFSQTLFATGAAGYSWSFVSGTLPPGSPALSVSPAGVLSGTPNVPGIYNFVIKAADSSDPTNKFALRQFTMNVTPIAITSSFTQPNGSSNPPVFYSTTLTTTGATGAVTWTIDHPFSNYLPPGLTLVGNVISGTPTQSGQFSFSLIGTDTAGHVVSRRFTISIFNGPSPVDLSLNGTNGDVFLGTFGLGTIQMPLAATGGTPPYHYSITSGAVPGLRTLDGPPLPAGFAPIGGAYVGVATVPGNYTSTVRVTDALGAFIERHVQIIVSPVGFTSQTTLPRPAVGVPYGPFQLTTFPDSANLITSNGVAQSVNGWSIQSGSLPPGLAMDYAGRITGTPTSSGGLFPGITRELRSWTDSNTNGLPDCIQATAAANGECGAWPDITPLRVTETLNTDPFGITTSGVLPPGTVGTPYAPTTLTASNCGTGCTWTWNLFVGLTLNSTTGQITGTPTSAFNSSLTVTATGSNGVVSKIFSLLINPSTPGALVIATSAALPTPQGATLATVGYSLIGTSNVATILTANGGTPPYSWSIQSGTLPPGITLQGPGRSPGCQVFDQAAGVCTTPLPVLPADAVLGGNLAPGQTYLAGKLMGVNVAQEYDFTLAVTDAAARTVTKAMQWRVTPITLSSSTFPIAGNPLVYNTFYTQALLALGGSGVYTSWSIQSGALPPGLNFDTSTAVISGTPSNTGSFTTFIQVTDDAGVTSVVPVNFTVSAPAGITTINLNLPTSQTVQRSTVSFLNLQPSGGTGPYTFTALSPLPPGYTIQAGDAILTNGTPGSSYFLAGTPVADGVFVFTVRVQDAGGINFGVRTFTLTVSPFTSVFTNLPDATVGAPYSQPLRVSGNVAASWSMAPTSNPLPPGLALSSDGVLSGMPTAGPTTAGTYSLLVIATGSGVSVPITYLLRISNLSITNAIPNSLLPFGRVGVPYSLTFTATGGGGPLSWSATGLPSGLTLDPATGTLSGTITSTGTLFTGNNGTFNVVVTVTDGAVGFSKRFGFFVGAANPSSALTTAVGNLGDVVVGQNFNASLNASGGMPPYTWALAPGSTLPPGLQFLSGADITPGTNPAFTQLIGAPSVANLYTFDVIVSDSAIPAAQVRRTLQLNVSSIAILANVGGNIVPRNGTVGVPYAQRFTAVGGSGPYTFTATETSLGSGTFPAEFTLSPDGLLSGTPTTTGVYTFVLHVQDSTGQTFSRAFTSNLLVMNSFGLVVANSNPDDVSIGSGRASHNLNAFMFNGSSSTYTWSLAPGSGPLPPGLSLLKGPFSSPNDTYVVGQATVPGTYVYTVRAKDDANALNFADRTYTMRVSPMQFASPNVAFSEEPDLPSAQVGVPYSFLFRMAGKGGPFTFTESPFVPIPAGFSLSATGVLSGTAETTGVYFVQPIVSDSNGHTLNGPLMTFVVTPAGVPPRLLYVGNLDELPTPSVGQPYDLPLTLPFFVRYGVGPLTVSLESGTLPPGLSIVNGNHLAGTPTTPGDYTFAFTITDSTTGQSIRAPSTGDGSVTVSAVGLTPSTLVLPNGIAGVPYGPFTLVASGGTPSYTYRLEPDSDLPVGLTLDPVTGVLSGTPTSPGSFVLVFQVRDQGGTVPELFHVYLLTIADPPAEMRNSDVDGDGKIDPLVYRPSDGTWLAVKSTAPGSSQSIATLGSGSDLQVSGDFDGDGKVDPAVYRQIGQWQVHLSSTGATVTKDFGLSTDLPVPGDYDGDGKTDYALFRPSAGTWYYLSSKTGSPTPVAIVVGTNGDLPVPADYDGDGKTDAAVYRPTTSEWLRVASTTGLPVTIAFGSGSGGDRPVPKDYDGDGKTDLAVYDATGAWWIWNSSTGTTTKVAFGLHTDVPVPGDYDGDGLADLGLYRPSAAGVLYWRPVNSGTILAADLGQRGDRSLTGGLPFLGSSDATRARDYDGDRKADLAMYRPSDGSWHVLRSSSGYTTALNKPFGLPTDTPAPGDYDGDGRTDLGVYHRTGQWDVLFSSTNYTTGTAANFGLKTDLPVPGDYDGDGTTDWAVYRPSTNTWYVWQSSTNLQTAFVWGAAGDVPVPGDFDGDGLADYAVYRPSTLTWRISLSTTNNASSRSIPLATGQLTDVPVPGDYDGDGRTDVAVFHLTGQWEVLFSSTDYASGTAANFGLSSDRPVPGDYDGDGRMDFGVYRPTTGTWYLLLSSSNYTVSESHAFGLLTDQVVPGAGFAHSASKSDLTRAGDYDGDGKRDVAVYTPGGGWLVRPTTTGYTTSSTTPWGIATDRPVPGDYDGDGQTDVAVFRPSTTTWYLNLSSTHFTSHLEVVFGLAGDTLVPGDYDGDGQTDVAVYHVGSWQIRLSSTGYASGPTIALGVSGDLPAPGDYDGDGKTDVGLFRPSDGTWHLLLSSTLYASGPTVALGGSTDIPVPGDYDGDGKTDVAVYHASGLWEALLSSTNFATNLVQPWGAGTDVPAPADYDGDGQVDFAIYRPSESQWYILESTTNYTAFVQIIAGTPLVDAPLPPHP